MRPRRGALGLRGRIVGAVLVTTVATLIVAALALLGPLEAKLRAAELQTFKAQLSRSITTPFQSIQLDRVSQYWLNPRKITKDLSRDEKRNAQIEQALQEEGAAQRAKVIRLESQLISRLGVAEVALFGYPDASGHGKLVARYPPDAEIAGADQLDDVARAFLGRGARYGTRSIAGGEYARSALPFTTAGPDRQPSVWVLAVRKPLAAVNDAVHAVRTAFIDAALAGLALTLVLAIPLSITIVRRLRRVRQAALELAEGRLDVQIPIDRARDEVGDLARTFAMMQAQLRQQEEARRAFVATASHELRTPLTSLEGMLELLEEDLADPHPDLDDARSLLDRARAQSRRLGRLAADLLDLSRIDAQVQLRSEPVELGELSRAVLAEFELGSSERGIHLQLHDEHRPVWALADPGSVARILRILLDNAMRVSPHRSEVIVELHGGNQAALSVCDNGPGIPVEDRDLIFERFQRGRNPSGQAGFGLGLAIGRELAQRMGGDLELEDGDSPGAKFTLRLPVATAPERDALAVL